MPASPSDSHLFGSLFNTPEIAAIFSDEQYIRFLLAIEGKLAKVQGKLRVIPPGAAVLISTGANTLQIDFDQLRLETEQAGFPVAEIVRQLQAHVGEGPADYVHWGVTAQDIMDTALILQIRATLNILQQHLHQLTRSLAALAARHRHTPMIGRAHAQATSPIPFGMKVVGWLAPLIRHRQRLAELRPRLLVLQFGGEVGALGSQSLAVQQALADELKLNVPPAPWHTQRDSLAELAGWLSLVTGGLAKMAQDVILLAQSEVAEVLESGILAPGGANPLSQRNAPTVSGLMLAAHRANASLLAAMHHAMVQEHEQGTHGWQTEWLSLPQMFALTASSLKKAIWLSENLVVNPERMRANLNDGRGLMLAEAISQALTPHLGRPAADLLVRKAAQAAYQQNAHLVEAIRRMTDAPIDWDQLKDETARFGAANDLIDRVLAAAELA